MELLSRLRKCRRAMSQGKNISEVPSFMLHCLKVLLSDVSGKKFVKNKYSLHCEDILKEAVQKPLH